MKPSKIIKTLPILMETHRPALLMGPPGCGKSSIFRAIAKETNRKLIDLRLSQFSEVDLRGVPSVDKRSKSTVWNAPGIFPKRGDPPSILLFDEITHASPSVQAAAYQAILDHRLGEHEFPANCYIAAAGNRVEDRALAQLIGTALRTRFVRLYYDSDLDDWVSMYAIPNNLAVDVIGFLRFRPMLLNELQTSSGAISKEERDRLSKAREADAIATERTWDFLSQVLTRLPPADIEYELYSGIIGQGPATEFMGYLKHKRTLPDLNTLLLNPAKAGVPNEPAVLYALATGLALLATPKNMDRVVKYLLRIPPEFQVLAMKDAVARNNKLADTGAFVDWVRENNDVMF